MTTPSQVPVRYPSGVSTDYQWGPLANYGQPNPFMYQYIADDFYSLLTADGPWGTVANGTGSATASTDGDGGLVLLTPSTSGAGTAGVIGKQNNFTLPPASYTGTGLTATSFPSKKVFFAARVNVTTVTGTTGYVGLMPKGTTTATPTDGIFFTFTSGTNVALQAYSGSTQQWTLPIPAGLLVGGANAQYGNALWVDLAFYMDRLQNVYGFFGFPLFGWTPASAWTGTNPNAIPGPLGACVAYQVGVSGSWTPTTAALTAGVIFSATNQTAYLDFIMAAKER